MVKINVSSEDGGETHEAEEFPPLKSTKAGHDVTGGGDCDGEDRHEVTFQQ